VVHVSEYKIGKKAPREPEKTHVILRVVCRKCGKKVDQTDVSTFMREYVCNDCKRAKESEPRKYPR
jgi:formylmethanofuran dehydrogenase subunit E